MGWTRYKLDIHEIMIVTVLSYILPSFIGLIIDWEVHILMDLANSRFLETCKLRRNRSGDGWIVTDTYVHAQ
jgi:hypothetical protein